MIKRDGGVDRVLMISNVGLRMVETQCAFNDAAKAAGLPHIVKFYTEEAKEKQEVLVGSTIETFFQDLRYAMRVLRRDPGFTFFHGERLASILWRRLDKIDILSN